MADVNFLRRHSSAVSLARKIAPILSNEESHSAATLHKYNLASQRTEDTQTNELLDLQTEFNLADSVSSQANGRATDGARLLCLAALHKH